MQSALFVAFAADSGRHPDLVDHARRFGLGEDLDSVCGGCDVGWPNLRERDPPAITMAKQDSAKKLGLAQVGKPTQTSSLEI